MILLITVTAWAKTLREPRGSLEEREEEREEESGEGRGFGFLKRFFARR